MKKLFFIICALLPGIAFPQYLSKEFTIDNSDVINSVALNVSVSNEDSLILLQGSHRASGLFVSGCANLNDEDESYVRITVRDTYNSDYLVYELYPLLTEAHVCSFSKIGLETAYLDNIQVQSIKIETLNASVTLDSVYFVVPERSSRSMRKATLNRKSQCEHIASRLNDRLIGGNKTWRAGVTFISQMTYEEKKGMFGGKVPVLYGFDYYKGGIFVMPGFYRDVPQVSKTRDTDNYVSEWDWRNRHGKNWVTSVKNQNYPRYCGSCWVFSALGAFESYINLYYNQLLNLDLSEQEIISCRVAGGDCSGGFVSDALHRVESRGAIPEECMVYQASDTIQYINLCGEEADCLGLGGHSTDYYLSYNTSHSEGYRTEEDSIKRMLFRSPISFSIRSWGHAVVLVGFKQFQSGEYYFTYNHKNDSVFIDSDSLANHPAWLIKNSMGTDWGEYGFGYVATSLNNVDMIHKLTGDVSSLELTPNDIVCEDADGDGYFNWGIGERPSTIPSWAPIEEDGDDSDCTKRNIDRYGNLQAINLSDTLFIDSTDDYTFSYPQYDSCHIKIYNEVALTISSQVFCCRGVSITIERGSSLIVSEGGLLENVILKPQPGSRIIIEEGGRIKHNKDVNFKIPIGVTLELNHGKIE